MFSVYFIHYASVATLQLDCIYIVIKLISLIILFLSVDLFVIFKFVRLLFYLFVISAYFASKILNSFYNNITIMTNLFLLRYMWIQLFLFTCSHTLYNDHCLWVGCLLIFTEDYTQILLCFHYFFYAYKIFIFLRTELCSYLFLGQFDHRLL